jgi:hypothetical protein
MEYRTRTLAAVERIDTKVLSVMPCQLKIVFPSYTYRSAAKAMKHDVPKTREASSCFQKWTFQESSRDIDPKNYEAFARQERNFTQNKTWKSHLLSKIYTVGQRLRLYPYTDDRFAWS